MKPESLESNIIKIYMENPEAVFTIEEIIQILRKKRLRKSFMTVHRAVKKLENENILMIDKKGIYNQVSLNWENQEVIARIALIEIQKKNQIIKNLSKFEQKLFKELENKVSEVGLVSSVLVFGSYAKQKQRKDSDVDLLVIINGLEYVSKSLVIKIKEAIESRIKKLNLEFGSKINLIVISPEDLKDMLKSKEENIGKQSFKYHFIIKSPMEYWELIKKAYVE